MKRSNPHPKKEPPMYNKLIEIIKAQNMTITELIREANRLEEKDEMCSCAEQHPFFQYLMDLVDELAHTKDITDEHKQNILYTFTKRLLAL